MASLDGSTGGRAVKGGYSTSMTYLLEFLGFDDFGDFDDFGGGIGDFAGDFGDVDMRISTLLRPGTGTGDLHGSG